MSTPFIDALSDTERAYITKLSRGENRPSYYDASIVQAARSSGDLDTTGQVQISQDLEAALILMPRDAKIKMRDFLQSAVALVPVVETNSLPDDFALMTEVVAVRKTGYAQINKDAGKLGLEYAAARASMLGDIEQRARANLPAGASAAEATSVIIPDVGVMFAALSTAYDDIIRPDDLALHDRIADVGYLYTVQNSAMSRSNEISSWVGIFNTYLTVS